MAKKFIFPMETLLKVRLNKEEEIKLLFSKSKMEKSNIENNLKLLKDNYIKYSKIDEKETVVSQKIKKNFLSVLVKKIEECEKELETKNKEVEVRRKELQKRTIDRKTVELLKENAFNKYINEVNKLEQIQNDEFALNLYIKSLKGGENDE